MNICRAGQIGERGDAVLIGVWPAVISKPAIWRMSMRRSPGTAAAAGTRVLSPSCRAASTGRRAAACPTRIQAGSIQPTAIVRVRVPLMTPVSVVRQDEPLPAIDGRGRGGPAPMEAEACRSAAGSHRSDGTGSTARIGLLASRSVRATRTRSSARNPSGSRRCPIYHRGDGYCESVARRQQTNSYGSTVR